MHLQNYISENNIVLKSEHSASICIQTLARLTTLPPLVFILTLANFSSLRKEAEKKAKW